MEQAEDTDPLDSVLSQPPDTFPKVSPPGGEGIDIDQAMAAWLAGEKQSIDAISRETFGQTLDMSGDWGSNYYMQVYQGEPRATTPDGVFLILHSRRFAKMLEETQGGLTSDQILTVTNRLSADIEQWAKLAQRGQKLRGVSVTFGGPSYKTEDLLFPLTFRINSAILLLGERSVREGLPLILKSADVTGVDTNWSGCAYACDKILMSMERGSLPASQAAVLDSYRQWKVGEANKSFAEYKVIDLPSYRSAQRPHERATSMGLPASNEKGTVSVEVPPIYRVYLLQQPENGSPYLDTSGTTEVAKHVVEYARKFSDAAK
jgi:hypothetical protein